MNIGVRRFRVRAYENPSTIPSVTSWGKSRGAKCAPPKITEEKITAPGVGSHFVREARILEIEVSLLNGQQSGDIRTAFFVSG